MQEGENLQEHKKTRASGMIDIAMLHPEVRSTEKIN